MPKTMLALALALALLLLGPAAADPARAEVARVSLSDLSPDQAHNASLAARAVSGTWVPAGSAFSFNNTTGPRDAASGWLEAPDASGATVPGGGADRAAALLYQALAVLDADVEFTDLRALDGGRRVDVEGADLCFSNPGGPFTIEMWIEDDALCCSVTPDEADPEPADDDHEGAMLPPAALLAAIGRVVCSGGDATLANASLAADSVCDTTLSAGDSFSFNDAVGPRTPECGYRDAPDGRGETVCGGGVEQLASAVWLAVQAMDDVSVLEKATYGDAYARSYVASAADAVLVDGADFAFRYNGEGSITLFTYVEDGVLYCDIYRQ